MERLIAMGASTGSESADLFAEFLQTTYSSASLSNSNYPNPLNTANCNLPQKLRKVLS